MNWLFLILVSTCAYAIVTLVDRVVMGMRLIRPSVYLLATSLVGILIAVVLMLALAPPPSGGIFVDFSSVLLGLLAGALYGAFTYLYFRSLQVASPVATVLYMQLIPFITAFSSMWLLNEELGEYTLIAILALCIGFSFLSQLDVRRHARIARAMIPAAILLAAGLVLQKQLLITYGRYEILTLNRIGSGVLAGSLFWFGRRRFPHVPVPNAKRRLLLASIIGLTECTAVLALLLALMAYQVGPFAEVSAIASMLPLAVLGGSVLARCTTGRRFWDLPEAESWHGAVAAVLGTLLIGAAIFLLSRR